MLAHSSSASENPSPMQQHHDIMTLPEVASHMRVSRNTVYRMGEARVLTFHKIGRSIRFRRRDIDAFVERRRIESRDNWT